MAWIGFKWLAVVNIVMKGREYEFPKKKYTSKNWSVISLPITYAKRRKTR
jgi:hypothetical protein